ncbi:FAD-dependent oxidoreductase, partial [Patescibacteria group bacterium]
PRFYVLICFLFLSLVILLQNFGLKNILQTSLFDGTPEIEANLGYKEMPSLESSKIAQIKMCDVAIVGGGTSGFAAGVQSARLGIKTCIFEEGFWLGGMFTSAGVSAFDGGSQDLFRGGIFGEVRTAIDRYYDYNPNETRQCGVSYLCFEPRIGKRIVHEIVKNTENLQVFNKIKVTRVYRTGNKVTGIQIKNDAENEYIIPTKVLIDATEFGDIIKLSGASFDLGPDSGSKEPHNDKIEDCIQPITYVMILSKFKGNVTIPEPPNYKKENYICSIKNDECPNAEYTFEEMLEYGRLPNNKFMINWPHDRWGNDYFATDSKYDLLDRLSILQNAKYYSLGFLYYLQTELGHNDYGLTNEFSTNDKLPTLPYVRESRRIKGVERIDEFDILPDSNGNTKLQQDVIAIVDHPVDLHFCSTNEDLYVSMIPFQLPYGVLVPEKVDGLLAAEKNISVSHLVNGATRVQPVVMTIGQAAGAAAAIAVNEDVELRDVDVKKIQNILLEDKVALYFYQDISANDPLFKEIMKSSINGVFKGFQNKYFYPQGEISRQDLVTLVYRSLYKNQVSEEDQYINIAFQNGIISGYNIDGKVYLDLESPVTRAQALKILLKAYNYTELQFKVSPFNDVDEWAKGWVERAYSLGIIKGVNNTKFEPNRNLTRGEAATIVSRLLEVRGE